MTPILATLAEIVGGVLCGLLALGVATCWHQWWEDTWE